MSAPKSLQGSVPFACLIQTILERYGRPIDQANLEPAGSVCGIQVRPCPVGSVIDPLLVRGIPAETAVRSRRSEPISGRAYRI